MATDKITLPSTQAIGFTLVAIVAPLLALGAGLGWWHWTPEQTAGVSSFSLADIALVMALVAHFRKDTPTRWVAVFGLIGPVVVTGFAVLTLFGVWTALTGVLVLAVLSPLLALFGISVSQNAVWSPESHQAEIAVAQAAALRKPA